jgi:hypothetical protein
LPRYYTDEAWTVLKNSPLAARPVPHAQILEFAFANSCAAKGVKPPTGSTIVNWMKRHFGPSSPHGHTVLHTALHNKYKAGAGAGGGKTQMGGGGATGEMAEMTKRQRHV